MRVNVVDGTVLHGIHGTALTFDWYDPPRLALPPKPRKESIDGSHDSAAVRFPGWRMAHTGGKVDGCMRN
jgi:hypothetical protein